MKMSHPDHARPLAVQPEDVDARKAEGWTEVKPTAAPAESKPPAKKSMAAKKAVTRKSAGKKS